MSDPEPTGAIHRSPVSYIDKSREFYAAHGYARPYRWAAHGDAPFTPMRRAVDAARVGVVTTAFPAGHHGAKRVYAAPASPVPAAMFTDDLSWDSHATHTDDVGSFLPLRVLDELASDGTIGSASPRFYGLPTLYSQRQTRDCADEILELAAADEIDLMLLVPL